MADILGPANADNSVTTRPAESRGFGSVDTFFKDCTAPTAEDGTEFQASFFNGLIAALRVVSRINGKKIDAVTDIVTDDGADDNILAKALQNLIQRGQQAYAVGSGTANAIIATLSPVPSELKAGLVVRVKVGTSNTDVATINVNGSGAIAIKHPNGAGLVSGDLIAGGIAWLIFDGTYWQLAASHTDVTGGGVGSRYICPYANAAGTALAITATYSPATATAVAGDFFAVKLTAGIAGATTFNPDAHGAASMVDSSNVALASGFAANGDLLLLQFDGTKYRVMNRPPQTAPTVILHPAIGSYHALICEAQYYLGGGVGSLVSLPGLPGSWKVLSYASHLYTYSTVEGGYSITTTTGAFYQRTA